MNFTTKEQAKVRLAELAVNMSGLDKFRKNKLILEKLQIEQLLGSGVLPSEAEAKGSAKRNKKDAKAARKPPLFVDDYVGPRCDYCSGPKPQGVCLNAGPDWPHPPEASA